MSGGVGAALGQAIEGEAGMAEVVQAGLFEELEVCETGALDAPSPLSAALPSAGKRVGRPKGSKNRRTEAVTAWLLTQHRHPLSVMMEAYSMSTIELAARLGLQTEENGLYSNDLLVDLFKLQTRMAEATAPYVAQKLPQAVQVEGGASLTVNFGGVDLGGIGTGVSVPARGEADGQDFGNGMSVRLGQVGRKKSDDDLAD